MVAPDLQGRGLGRELLALGESLAPPSVTGFWLTTGVLEEGNQRFYKRAGYRLVARRAHATRARSTSPSAAADRSAPGRTATSAPSAGGRVVDSDRSARADERLIRRARR